MQAGENLAVGLLVEVLVLAATDQQDSVSEGAGYVMQCEGLTVTKRPLDVESDNTLSGEVGVSETKKKADNAPFVIRVVKKVPLS